MTGVVSKIHTSQLQCCWVLDQQLALSPGTRVRLYGVWRRLLRTRVRRLLERQLRQPGRSA